MLRNEPFLVEFDDIGPVTFRPDRRCRRLSIRLKPLEGIHVLFPPGFPVKSAIAFVKEKKQWIIQSLKKMAVHEENYTIFDETTVFFTRSFSLKIQKAQREDVRLVFHCGILNVFYPEHLPVTEEPVQEAIRFGIVEALRMEAKRFLPGRLDELAQKHGFQYNRVYIKNMKSRWGSCSGQNNINLNLHLMRLPDHLIDYVLLHELCHLVEKNHGERFWNLLNNHTNGKAKLLAREMKQYLTSIY